MNNTLKLFLVAVFILNVSVVVANDVFVEDETDTDIVVVDDTEFNESEYGLEQTDVAEDESVQNVPTVVVSARMDCATIKTKITELTASQTDADALAKLQKQYRNNCSVHSATSRATRRNVKSAESVTPTPMPTTQAPNVKDEAMVSAATLKKTLDTINTEPVAVITDEQKQMCERISDMLDTADDSTKSVLQETYDAYCVKNVAAPASVIKTTMLLLGPAEPAEPAETEEEKNDRIANNLAAGLCADGTKPNKYGCCAGEKFKDMGDLQFACCLDDGSACYPPIEQGL